MEVKAFSNVPSHLQAKMEQCVQKVKKQGHSKKSAIAICYDSVVKGKSLGLVLKEYPMQKTKQGKTARQRRKERQRAEMRNTEEAKLLAEDPVADEIAWEAYKESGWWNVDLTAHTTDETSDMDRVEYFINDGHHETIEGSGPDYVFTIQWSELFRRHTGWFYHYDRAGNVIAVNFSFAIVESVPKSQSQQQHNFIYTRAKT